VLTVARRRATDILARLGRAGNCLDQFRQLGHSGRFEEATQGKFQPEGIA
jgi:hypothetical protein